MSKSDFKFDKNLLDYISEHENDNAHDLLLKCNNKDFNFKIAADIIISRQKIRKKLPHWYAEKRLIYPNTISAEQCSSEDTANYKAKTAYRIAISGKDSSLPAKIADLTGGLGVDCEAFAKTFNSVFYNEMDENIFNAANYNLPLLGVNNIEFHNYEAKPSEKGPLLWENLKNFKPSIIFLDPARRNISGGKVVRIEDCSPNLTEILPDLFKCSDNIIVKFSPMLDISSAVKTLKCVTEVHAVSSGGECKEILLVLQDKKEEVLDIKQFIRTSKGGELSFYREEERKATPILSEQDLTKISQDYYIFEPDKAITKSGAFNLICKALNLVKIGISTHLYLHLPLLEDGMQVETLCNQCANQYAEKDETSEGKKDISQFGRIRKIIEIVPMDKKSIKSISKKYPNAEITARNLKISSDVLAKKMKLRPNGNTHIFAVKADFAGGNLIKSKNYLIVTE